MIKALVMIAIMALAITVGRSFYGLYVATLALFLLVQAIGVGQVDIIGLKTNVGTIWYSGVLIGFIGVYHAHGLRFVRRLQLSCGALAVAYMALITSMKYIAADAEVAEALAVLTKYNLQVTVVSFLAFIMASSLMIRLMETYNSHNLFVAFAILAAGQALDSVIFFPLAFGGLASVNQLATMIFDGIVVKYAISAIGLPVLWIADRVCGRHSSLPT